MADERKAERRVGLARFWARARQVLTTDPTGSDEDDLVVEEAGATALAAQARAHRGGTAKLAQLAAYDPLGQLGTAPIEQATGGRAALAALWDRMPGVAAAEIAAVIEADLGDAPERLFARWDRTPLAAASLGQVHAATAADGAALAVKVQYPGVAAALTADAQSTDFVRRLAGSEVGRALDADAIDALRAAVIGELDYRAEAAALTRFGAAWADDPAIQIPAVIADRSAGRVLTMTRAPGLSLVAAAQAAPEVRNAAAAAIVRFAWGSPLVHGLLNADPNPGNYLVATDGGVAVWFLDFGCAVTLDARAIAEDRALWHGVLDDDVVAGAERFRMALAGQGVLRRTASLATSVHRDWERAVAAPFRAPSFCWTRAYAAELTDATRRALAAGGLGLPARAVMLWRARLGVASVLGMLEPTLPFRQLLLDLIGTGRAALR
jgi:hypothetical protein